MSLATKELCFKMDAVHTLGIYAGKETLSTLQKICEKYFNDIPLDYEYVKGDKKYMVHFYICADHMAHYRMGACDAPACKTEGYRLCQYCCAKPIDIRKPKADQRIYEVVEEPKCGAGFPNIPMTRRPPDLLHMVKNVTHWMMTHTSRYIVPNLEPESDSHDRSKQKKLLRRRQKKWVDEIMEPWLYKARKYATMEGPDMVTSKIPMSAHSAYWQFMKEDSGWKAMSLKIKAIGLDREGTGQSQNSGDKRPRDEDKPKWNLICNIWEAWAFIFSKIKSFDNPDLCILEIYFNYIRNITIKLKWTYTPWAHIFIEHYIYFEKLNVRPIFLTCHAIESNHRKTKKDFQLSLKSTIRRKGRSGLVDILYIDNIILELIKYKIFPWEKLKINLGSSFSLKRGQILNYVRENIEQ